MKTNMKQNDNMKKQREENLGHEKRSWSLNINEVKWQSDWKTDWGIL